ncbi:DNA polymerase III subunit gamma/tau [Candidatus Microgenomates bacterium]|nr:DNA polymerase III subunit gamma/tau [Candidatus Microgenomates bacterium]
MVFYRKYRPQKIEELDLGPIRKNLSAILDSDSFPHAFLFTGPRGLGKTSAARIVAKSVNCLKKKKGEPCNECLMCTSITEGRNLDVFEIDAASNRGIDEIRDLREKIKLAPSGAKFKVYIIDEVHMLTIEAFNALLKMLEEPPSHAIFVLCTTEVHKLPQTVISRCLRFDFKRATEEDIIRSLERMSHGEKVKVEKDALMEIARGADGSFREAAKILEQAFLLREEITSTRIKEILGDTNNLDPGKLIKILGQRDSKKAVSEVALLVKEGINLQVYTEKILSQLHRILMVKIGVEAEESGPAEIFTKEELIKLIEIFSRVYQELKTAIIPQLPLEIAVIEYCDLPSVQSEKPTFKAAVGEEDGNLPKKIIEMSEMKNPKKTSAAPKGELLEIWPQVIKATQNHNHTLAGILRGCQPVDFNGKILTIATNFKFHKDRLEDPKTRELLEKAAAEVWGKEIGVKCQLGEAKKDQQKEVI